MFSYCQESCFIISWVLAHFGRVDISNSILLV